MGILSRFSDIIKANINELIDKAEDPSKMIDQYLRNAMEDLAEVKKETAGVMAEEKRCKRILDEAKADMDKYMEMAKKAVAAGNDGDAKVLLAKKQEAEAAYTKAESLYAVAKGNADKMRQMHNKLVDDIEGLKARRANIKATVAVAKTQDRMSRAAEAANGARGSLAAFDRMEEKAQAMLDRSDAAMELAQEPVDEAAALIEKYSSGGSASVDDELAALKAEMGL